MGSTGISSVETSFDKVYNTFWIWDIFFMGGECAKSINFFQRINAYMVGVNKFICPFGIVIAGTAFYSDNNLKFAANTLAEILDQDGDGVVDNIDMQNNLKKVMAGGGDWSLGEEACSMIIGFDYCFGLQAYKAEGEVEYMKGIIREEIFHMVTQHGWAKVWPDKFGDSDFTSSTMCQEMASLQCVQPGWWHEENQCPSGAPFSTGSPASSPLSGTCNEANCDCVEFFHQAVLLHNDQQPGWLSPYMPTTQAATQSMLSTAFKNLITDSTYGVPDFKLTGVYTAGDVSG